MKTYRTVKTGLERMRKDLGLTYSEIEKSTGYSVSKIQGKEKVSYITIDELLYFCNKMHWSMRNFVYVGEVVPKAMAHPEAVKWENITFDACKFSEDVRGHYENNKELLSDLNLTYRSYSNRFSPTGEKPHYLSLDYIVYICNKLHFNLGIYLHDPQSTIEDLYMEGDEGNVYVGDTAMMELMRKKDDEINRLRAQLAEANIRITQMRSYFLMMENTLIGAKNLFGESKVSDSSTTQTPAKKSSLSTKEETIIEPKENMRITFVESMAAESNNIIYGLEDEHNTPDN